MDFRWNDWNLDHATSHGVSVEEIEFLVSSPRRPYPEEIGDAKYLVVGQAPDGRYIQVIYLVDEDGTLFVIHSRPLNDSEKRRFRRRTR